MYFTKVLMTYPQIILAVAGSAKDMTAQLRYNDAKILAEMTSFASQQKTPRPSVGLMLAHRLRRWLNV